MSTSKFKGSGINFNAKLLGVAEVSETRNEKMCQDAITHLKLSLLNSGEHKQKILVNVSLSGLLIVDAKTNVSRIQFHILGWVSGRGFGLFMDLIVLFLDKIVCTFAEAMEYGIGAFFVSCIASDIHPSRQKDIVCCSRHGRYTSLWLCLQSG